MYCSACGNALEVNQNFCPKCGSPRRNDGSAQATSTDVLAGSGSECSAAEPEQVHDATKPLVLGLGWAFAAIDLIVLFIFIVTANPGVRVLIGALNLVVAGFTISVAASKGRNRSLFGLLAFFTVPMVIWFIVTTLKPKSVDPESLKWSSYAESKK
jgi:hypothetical protein